MLSLPIRQAWITELRNSLDRRASGVFVDVLEKLLNTEAVSEVWDTMLPEEDEKDVFLRLFYRGAWREDAQLDHQDMVAAMIFGGEETLTGDRFKVVSLTLARAMSRAKSGEIDELRTELKGDGGEDSPSIPIGTDGEARLADRARTLRNYLGSKGWTKADLERESGIEHRTLQRILDGKPVKPNTMEKLAPLVKLL